MQPIETKIKIAMIYFSSFPLRNINKKKYLPCRLGRPAPFDNLP
jgi:hypothetical protein